MEIIAFFISEEPVIYPIIHQSDFYAYDKHFMPYEKFIGIIYFLKYIEKMISSLTGIEPEINNSPL